MPAQIPAIRYRDIMDSCATLQIKPRHSFSGENYQMGAFNEQKKGWHTPYYQAEMSAKLRSKMANESRQTRHIQRIEIGRSSDRLDWESKQRRHLAFKPSEEVRYLCDSRKVEVQQADVNVV